MTTIDVDLQALATNIAGWNNGQIRGLRDRILGKIEEIRQEVAARVGGRVARPTASTHSTGSGIVPTHMLEQTGSLKQRQAHYLDMRLPDPVKIDVSPVYSPAPVVKEHTDPELAQVDRDSRCLTVSELLTLRTRYVARIWPLEQAIAQRIADYSHPAHGDRHPPSADRNVIDRRQIGQIQREVAYIEALLETPVTEAA